VQLAFAAVILVAAGVAGALIANALNNNSSATATATATTTAAAVSGPSCDVTSVAQEKLPTVVTILAHGTEGAASARARSSAPTATS
jgi:hypothetical protein